MFDHFLPKTKSGGGVYFENNTLVGLVSFSSDERCDGGANQLTVLVNVAHFFDWIESQANQLESEESQQSGAGRLSISKNDFIAIAIGAAATFVGCSVFAFACGYYCAHRKHVIYFCFHF